MKRFLTIISLSLLCASVALAGEIPSVGAPQPPQPQMTSSSNPGEIPSGDMARSISDAALSAILTALGLASI
jgi:hypothetical protein